MVNLRGYFLKLKYCDTCEMYRPPRSIHCDDCGACILVLDHHCPWVGSCIGKRNYRFFLLFVNSTGLMIAYFVICLIWNLHSMAQDFQANDISIVSVSQGWKESLKKSPYSIILLFLCVLFAVFVWLLCIYHHFLMCIRQTTNEHLKKTFKSGMNPFRKTYCRYFVKTCSKKKKKRLWKPRNEPKLFKSMRELIENDGLNQFELKNDEPDLFEMKGRKRDKDYLEISGINPIEQENLKDLVLAASESRMNARPGEIYEDEWVNEGNSSKECEYMSPNGEEDPVRSSKKTGDDIRDKSISYSHLPIQKQEIYESKVLDPNDIHVEEDKIEESSVKQIEETMHREDVVESEGQGE
mmetsp:Transcript_1019/g.1006  ORF Transcript_1019/g.1006 Transcript_1019/m.1006 type:complete len:353 (+) Transcript_1019:411-1469(+)